MSLEQSWGNTIHRHAAGTAIVRRMTRIRVRIQSSRLLPPETPLEEGAYQVIGLISMEIGNTEVAPMRFKARVQDMGDSRYIVDEFRPIQGGGGGLAVEKLSGIYEGALEEVLSLKPGLLD